MSTNSTPARLIAANGSAFHLGRDGMITIGSGTCDIVLPDPGVNGLHATLTKLGGRVMIKPTGGDVAVNGQVITSMTELKHNDQVRIGGAALRFESSASTVSTQPAPSTQKPHGFSSDFEPMFKEPPKPAAPPPVTTQPSSISNPRPAPTVHPLEEDDDDAASASTGSSIIPAPPSQPVPVTPQRLSQEDRHYILEKFFSGGQIFKKDVKGNSSMNYSERWRYARSNFEKGVLLVEGGIRLAAWLAQQGSAQKKKNYKPPVTGESVDEAIQDLIADHIEIAKDELGILDSQLIHNPLVINGPIFWRDPLIPIEHLCTREADDGYMRFSAQKVSIMLLTDKRIGVYIAYLDTIAGHATSQSAETYLYQHVTGITAKDVQVQLDFGSQQTKAIMVHTFRMSVMGGDSVEIALSSPAIKDQFGAHVRTYESHKRTINAVRQMWLTKTGN